MLILYSGWVVALASPFVVALDDSQRAGLEQLAGSRTAPVGRVARAKALPADRGAAGHRHRQVLTETISRNDSDAFIRFLRLLDSTIAAGQDPKRSKRFLTRH